MRNLLILSGVNKIKLRIHKYDPYISKDSRHTNRLHMKDSFPLNYIVTLKYFTATQKFSKELAGCARLYSKFPCLKTAY
jgi:hypothetical protein